MYLGKEKNLKLIVSKCEQLVHFLVPLVAPGAHIACKCANTSSAVNLLLEGPAKRANACILISVSLKSKSQFLPTWMVSKGSCSLGHQQSRNMSLIACPFVPAGLARRTLWAVPSPASKSRKTSIPHLRTFTLCENTQEMTLGLHMLWTLWDHVLSGTQNTILDITCETTQRLLWSCRASHVSFEV